ncbi:hypothetical protein [Streptomyces sp. N50]|uniref:hypothetical protein n=1 Tax=Streptomyces sp. N50 TaxID=3081765 RepID=UPI002962190C|nr:hypothetical protein [Streptomyces sp. N50]WOX12518.1 hypothetical protein R2B38_28420 [Streptomyces sp. N50]
MSWDVLLLNLPDDITSAQDIPDDYTPRPLGRLHEVLATVTRAEPATDLADPTWGDLTGPTWSIELSIGSEDPVDSIMLHVWTGTSWIRSRLLLPIQPTRPRHARPERAGTLGARGG